MHFNGTPRLLGYLGLIPFFAFTILAWTQKYHDISVQLLAVYAVVILTFIGAVHWGIALSINDKPQNRIRYAYSVIPSIIAWLLVSIYNHLTLPLLMVSFFMCFIFERGFFLLIYRSGMDYYVVT